MDAILELNWRDALHTVLSTCGQYPIQTFMLLVSLTTTILGILLVGRTKSSSSSISRTPPKNRWDSAKRALQKADTDIASVTGSFKDAGMSAQMGRRRRRRRQDDGPDIEDACVVQ